MLNKIKALLVLGISVLTAGCSESPVDEYKDYEPKFIISDFFNGELETWGMIQDWRGHVTLTFHVAMQAKWTGNNGVLEEDFEFSNGEKLHRTWYLTKLENGSYRGTASDVVGEAKGVERGSAAHFVYNFMIPFRNKHTEVKIDDRMFMLQDGSVLNKSRIYKFGIFKVGEINMYIRKVIKN